MAVTAVATAIMVATMAITTEGLTSIFSATAMAEAGTPSIIAIEVQEVVEWPYSGGGGYGGRGGSGHGGGGHGGGGGRH